MSSKTTTSRPPFQITVSGGLFLLLAAIYFFYDLNTVLALILAVLPHEMGHLIAMRFFGLHPTKLTAKSFGFSIDYSGDTGGFAKMLTALAGPALGLGTSLLISRIGAKLSSDDLLFCAGLGYLVNAFNLLPAMPLDGGRVLRYLLSLCFGYTRSNSIVFYLGIVVSWLLICFGIYLIAIHRGAALLIAGICLFVLQCKNTCK